MRGWLTLLWKLRSLWSAICKLRLQESQWCSVSPCWKAWEPVSQWCELWSISESLRTRSTDIWVKKMDVPAQAREQICLSSAFWFYSGPQWMPTCIGKTIFFSLQIQMLISSRNTLIDTPWNNGLPAVWASCSWHTQLNITRKQRLNCLLSHTRAPNISALLFPPLPNLPHFLFKNTMSANGSWQSSDTPAWSWCVLILGNQEFSEEIGSICLSPFDSHKINSPL